MHVSNAYEEHAARIIRRRHLRYWVRRIMPVMLFLALAAVVGSTWWLIESGTFARGREWAKMTFYRTTSAMGWNVEQIYVEGLETVKPEAVSVLLPWPDAHYKVPIFSISLTALKESIEKISWVKQAIVLRQLPDTLHVIVEERVPTALWQYQGILNVVDEDGVVLSTRGGESHRPLSQFLDLPMLVGEDAPKHYAGLYRVLHAEPEIANQVASSVWVGGRRWDIYLQSGIVIKLPEHHPEEAWRRLRVLQEQKHVLNREIKGIDFRLPDRLYIQVKAEDPAQPTTMEPQ